MKGPLFLIGYMGCGKSTLGRKIARRTGVTAIDTDAAIEAREGAPINDIFRYEGEPFFRQVEREVLDALIAAGEARVIATGGGLPAWGDNMARMNEAGCTCYLRRSPANIASRLSLYGRQRRPRLRGLNDEELVAFMTADMAAREPFYAQAQLTIDCDGLTDEAIIERIFSTFSFEWTTGR